MLSRRTPRPALIVTLIGMVGAGLLAAPRPARAAPAASKVIVVAAENVYGDIAGQIGGDHVAVTSIMYDPNVDPHAYESRPQDAAAVANAALVIQNGLGYDDFLTKLMAASPNPKRKVINVAELTGHKKPDNVHIWYDPPTLPKLAQAILDALVRIDPANAASHQHRYRAFQASLPAITQLIASMKTQYAGTPIAVTEPVWGYITQAVGLNVITPLEFQKAIEEGQDPPAAAIAQMEDHLKKQQVKVLIYNVQTVSPITTRIQQLAKQSGVPIVPVYETLPPGTSWQTWVTVQLEAVRQALGPAK